MRRIVAILLCVIVIFVSVSSLPASAVADWSWSSGQGEDVEAPEDDYIGFGEQPAIEERDSGWVGKLISAPLIAIRSALFNALGLASYEELIYNHDWYGNSLIEADGSAGSRAGDSRPVVIPPFITAGAWAIADNWFSLFTAASAALALMAIIFTGIKAVMTATNPRKREETRDAMLRWFYSVVLIFAAPTLLYVLMQINLAAVDMCYAMLIDSEAAVVLEGGFVNGISDILTTSILHLGTTILLVYFNVIYIVRTLNLLALFAFTPVLVWLWALNNNMDALKVWLGESVSVIFMQFSHAFALTIFLQIVYQLPSNTQWWAMIVALVAIVPFAKVLRDIFQGFFKYLGVDEERVAGKITGRARQVATFASLMMLTRGLNGSSGVKGLFGSSGTATSAGSLAPEATAPLSGVSTMLQPGLAPINTSTPSSLNQRIYNRLGGSSDHSVEGVGASMARWGGVGRNIGKVAGGAVAVLPTAATAMMLNPVLARSVFRGISSAGGRAGQALSSTGFAIGGLVNSMSHGYTPGEAAIRSASLVTMKDGTNNEAVLRQHADGKSAGKALIKAVLSNDPAGSLAATYPRNAITTSRTMYNQDPFLPKQFL